MSHTQSTTAHPPAGTAGDAFRLRAIVKRWQRSPAPVLDGVDLELPPGTVLGVRGRNGAGKTTLLRIAAGLITPDSGSVELGGVGPERDRRAFHRRVGFVSAGSTALYARLTVDNHLELFARMALLPKSGLGEARTRAIADFELDELRGRRVDRLSSGQRQRLRLALGFLHGPDVALLDEPETSLDEEGSAVLSAVVAALRARGGAVIVCSPTGTLERIDADRHCRIVDGRIEET